MMTSRGCPYRCTYCLNHKIVDRYKEELGRNVKSLGFFRFRPADKMIAEIRGVLARYSNIGTFILDDDLFTQNVPHALEFCARYVESGIGVPFVVNSHVKQLDERVAEALGRAGCRILKLGIESGSPRVRRKCSSGTTQKDILLTSIGRALAPALVGFLMIGLPTETEERWRQSTSWRSRHRRFRRPFFFPFPGTDSYRMTIEGRYGRPARCGVDDVHRRSCLDFGAGDLFIDQLGTCMRGS